MTRQRDSVGQLAASGVAALELDGSHSGSRPAGIGSGQERYTATLARHSGDLEAHLPRWRHRRAQVGDGLLTRDPDFALTFFRESHPKIRREDLWVFFVERGDAIAGCVPLFYVNWPLECLFGEIALARLPQRRLLLPFGDVDLPEDGEAYDAFFRALADVATGFDSIFAEDVGTDSFLWRHVHESPLVRRYFRIAMPQPPKPHSLIRMGGSFEEYLGKWSSRTRRTLQRKVRKLREKGELELRRITAPAEVPDFVRRAAVVSRNSYQYALFGAGMREEVDEIRTLGSIAEHGWLRSYLLSCGGEPCSYMIGYQDQRKFYYIDVAYDREWSALSPGTVLQYLVIEDLFAERTPEVFDFCGGHGDHKVFFENERYLGADLLLFPRGRVRPAFSRVAYTSSRSAGRLASSLLTRVGLHGPLRRLIRRAARGAGNGAADSDQAPGS